MQRRPLTEGDRKWRRRQIFLRGGQAVMIIGGLVILMHIVTHMGVFGGQPPLLQDLLLGYPMGGVIFVLGAILASRKPS